MFSAFRRAVEANDEMRVRVLFNQMLAEARVTSGEHYISDLTIEEEENRYAQHASLG
jgi:hypothetical protein